MDWLSISGPLGLKRCAMLMKRAVRCSPPLLGALACTLLLACGASGNWELIDIDLDSEAPEGVVSIASSRNPLIAGQVSVVEATVVNTSAYGATNVVVQVAAPIGFQYQDLTCLSSPVAACPPVTLQQLTGGFVFQTYPAGTQVSFYLSGVTTGAVGSQAVFTVFASFPGDLHPENNRAVAYVPISSEQ